jgi:RNA polymerase sigma-70 factor (ECF subfamily)
MTDALRGALAPLLPRLRRFAVSLTGTPAVADALVLEACEQALRAGDQSPPDMRLDGWLYRIMRGLWIARTTRSPDGARPAPVAPPADGASLDAVRAALAALPEEERSLLLLVCADGFTYQEAAAALDMPVGVVRARLARARLALLDGTSVEDER